jgi:NADPH-dependent 2,4-dienoyl-CoA reductase/sulfur reductase-like enzyme
MLFLMFA